MEKNSTHCLVRAVIIWVIIPVALCSVNETRLLAKESMSPVELSVRHEGTNLEVSITANKEIKEVELRFYSSRNRVISKETDVSIHDPKRIEKLELASRLDHNFWYPVVDMVLEPGFKGVAEFEEGPAVPCRVNGPYWSQKLTLEDRLDISAGQLEYWENSLRVESLARKLTDFYLSKRLPLVTPQLKHRFELLSEQWSGRVELHVATSGKIRKLAEVVVNETIPSNKAGQPGRNLESDNLLQALRGSVDFTLRCQNKNPHSPGFGGLFLFYDIEAATYRTSYWMWGWGPSVRLLLDTAERTEFGSDHDQLLASAKEIGECTLRFLWHAPGSPLDRIVLSRWDRGSQVPNGYQGAITFADSLFLAGWAWIPLYEKFGDERYLDLVRQLTSSSDRLMYDFKVLPHSYMVDTDSWTDFTLDECGFGMEGYAEAYRATQEESFRQVGRRYLNQHLDILENPDGGWSRSYKRLSDTVNPKTNHTRGQGWAMEGLLAAHRLFPDEGHLDRCRRMADNFVDNQLDSGCWAWRSDQPVEEVGISEKGTALWSYLLYRVYKYTDDKRYLDSARKALGWCLENQYEGPDVEARGSIPGRTAQSAVGYRQWFDVSCVYTSAFFGLAILEELQLQEMENQ